MLKIAFITGITGQDGSYLTEFLLEKDYIVYGIIRRSSSINTNRIDHLLKNKNLILHYGDLVDTPCLVSILNEIKTKYVNLDRLEIYNLAAQSHVKVSFELPEYTAQVDAIGTLRLLEAIKTTGLDKITRFYQASTSELYGQVHEIPQNENTPFHPRSPYGVAKLYGFWIVKNYREAYNMFACNGILFNHETVAGYMPMIYKTGNNSEIDIKPISEIVRFHTQPNKVLVNENINKYQEGEVLNDLYVWDNSNWTKVKYASGYRHDVKNNQKFPSMIISDKSCYMATGTHHIIMEDNSEKEVMHIKVNDKVKTIDLPKSETNKIEYFEAEFIAMILKHGFIKNDSINSIVFIYYTNEERDYNIILYKLICKKYNVKPTYEVDYSGGFIEYNDMNWFLCYEDIYNLDKTKRIPKKILNASIETKRAFLKRCKIRLSNSATYACGIYYLLDQVNKDCTIEVEYLNEMLYFSLSKLNKKNTNHVKSILDMDNYDGWFYDLETESGTFFCGIGKGLVHNSPRRGHNFVTRKVTIGLGKIMRGECDKLVMGNLDSLRDWGHAKDYVEGMWLMLQQEKPDDFVLATGEMHTVREFIEKAFSLRGFDIKWKGDGVNVIGFDNKTGRELIFVDAKYFRPAEVELLLGDATKAKNELGWIPKTSFDDLVKEMVDCDAPI